MGIVQVTLPDDVQAIIYEQVALGLVESPGAYLVEAARRLAADLQMEDEIVSEAELGIVEAEAGRYITIETAADADALYSRTMARLHERLTVDKE